MLDEMVTALPVNKRYDRAETAYVPVMLRPAYLSRKLDRPLPTKDGGTLRTIHDACDYMTGMGNAMAAFAKSWRRE